MFKKYLLFLIVLGLLVLVVPACGGGGEEIATTSIPTSVPTTTPVATSTPLGPVKIGAISPWSGPAAMSGLTLADPIIKLVEKQVKDQGGILGGRDVKVVRYDNHASAAESQDAVKTLVMDEKVCVITMGGVSGAEIEAIADAAEETKVLYVGLGPLVKPEEHKFMISATFQKEYSNVTNDLINKVLKPKTMAILVDEGVSPRDDVGTTRAAVEAAGTKTVYEQYVPVTDMDFTSYLTEIKSVKPDVLYIYFATAERNITIARQIMDLGGLDDTKVVALSTVEQAKGMPGVQGWYIWTLWIPGLDYPGAVKFENDFQAMYGQQPTSNHVYFYNSLWTAIYAIKLAGTDTDLVKIAEVTRSGNLEWDTPMGRAHYTADGSSGLRPVATQIVDGELVLVNIPQ